MKPSLWNLLPIIFLLISCQENEEPEGVEETFWVYSYTVPCQSTSNKPSSCLGISYAPEFDYNWLSLERIPLEIEGFTFKETFSQRIMVSKMENPTTGEVRRKLIRVLAEEKDFYELIEGGWKVKKYMGEDLPIERFPKGQSLSIGGRGIRIALSSDGCNSFNLWIRKVGPDKILSFGPLSTTLIACHGELLIIPFPGFGRNFKREGNTLTFYSDTEGEVAVWEKIN